MIHRTALLSTLASLLAACLFSLSFAGGGTLETEPAAQPPESTPESTEADEPLPGIVEAIVCATCHSNSPNAVAMRDADGHGIAPFDLWRSSMMANAARDPFWRAQVAAEVAWTPSRARDIEAKCLRCHAPLAQRYGLDDHDTGSLMHAVDCGGRLGSLARDGASCTICHGITPEGLGEDRSFSGHFELDPERRMFGPHANPFDRPMRMSLGFTPTRADHVSSSALCGSCHTLFTEPTAANGSPSAPGGEPFHEQTPYLEWRNSVFSEERESPGPLAQSCQDCHVPTTDEAGREIATRLAHNPGGRDFPILADRSPYGRHLLVGANTQVLALLRDHAEELRVEAPSAAFDATIEATRRLLRERTARVAIEDLERDGGVLRFAVHVVNLAGHKLPTGHPSRCVLLRVLVRDAERRIVAASGRTDARGRVVGADGEPLPSELRGGPLAPHSTRITGPDTVVQYRAVMADAEGRPTYSLMRAATWGVDDRLLPLGWSPEHAEAARTSPVGTERDDDFTPGQDRVEVRLAVPERGPLTVEVELLHQVLSGRWAEELFAVDAPEVRTFERLWTAGDTAPETIARDVARVR